MSRINESINDNVSVHYGNDHAIGKFIDIRDKRYANSGKDEQGEGYVVEWSEIFGLSNNLIGIKIEELKDPIKIEKLCNKFIKTLDV